MLLCSIKLRADGRGELDTGHHGFSTGNTAVDPDHSGRDHLPTVGQRTSRGAETHMNAERFSAANGGMRRQFDAKSGRADIAGLPAEIFATQGVQDFDRAVLQNPQPAPAFGTVGIVTGHLQAIVHQQRHAYSIKNSASIAPIKQCRLWKVLSEHRGDVFEKNPKVFRIV
jgi:hypothetical protein